MCAKCGDQWLGFDHSYRGRTQVWRGKCSNIPYTSAPVRVLDMPLTMASVRSIRAGEWTA